MVINVITDFNNFLFHLLCSFCNRFVHVLHLPLKFSNKNPQLPKNPSENQGFLHCGRFNLYAAIHLSGRRLVVNCPLHQLFLVGCTDIFESRVDFALQFRIVQGKCSTNMCLLCVHLKTAALSKFNHFEI